MPVLVTGAQGFVGAWLAERLLREGARVVAPRRDVAGDSRFRDEGIEERCDVVDADVADYAAVLRVIHEHRVRAVFHLAGQSVADVAGRSPYSTWESNVRGTYTVLEACRAAREVGEEVDRVVVASSALAYGPAGDRPLAEDGALAGATPYAAAKAAADVIARSYAASFGLPVAVTRMANTYGGGDLELSRVIPGACDALARGDRPVVLSDGTPVRQFLYVEDAVDAYLRVAASLDEPAMSGRAWNVGGPEAIAVIDAVRRLVELSGRDVDPDVRGEPGGAADRRLLDTTAIREELGWSPAWAPADGLAATYEWYAARAAS